MDANHTENLRDLVGRMISCEDPEQTFGLGAKVGGLLKGGEILLLSGPLGTGKTLFTKGMLSSLDFDEAEVTSPSFTLVNEYDARLTVYHIDVWRLDDPSGAAASIGLDELLDDAESVKIIEWAEKLGDYPFPPDAIRILIAGDGESPRLVSILDAEHV